MLLVFLATLNQGTAGPVGVIDYSFKPSISSIDSSMPELSAWTAKSNLVDVLDYFPQLSIVDETTNTHTPSIAILYDDPTVEYDSSIEYYNREPSSSDSFPVITMGDIKPQICR